MNEKPVTILANGVMHDLAVATSTTAADVRRQLNLPAEFLLSRRDGLPFGEHEDIWSKVQAGDKLFMTPPATVGTARRGVP